MHVDFLTMYANELAISGASKDSKVIDIGKAGISEGVGYIYVRNVGAVTGLDKVTLSGSSDNSEFTEVLSYKLTDLTDGGGINIPIPQGLPRYTKLVFTGTSMSGKVSAGVTLCAGSPRGKRIGDYEANPNYAG
jgi:hypothetical protein